MRKNLGDYRKIPGDKNEHFLLKRKMCNFFGDL